MTDVSPLRALRGLILFACFPALVYCNAGCAETPMGRARTVISVSAQAVVAVDRTMAPRYAEVAASGTRDQQRRWNAAVSSLLLTRSALLTAEAALDAIDAGGDGEIRGVMACVVQAVERLVEALPTIDVEVPEAVTLVLGLLGAYAGDCAPVDHAVTDGVPAFAEVVETP